MAFENGSVYIVGAEAAADYRTTSKQWYLMKKNSSDKRYALCDTDGEMFMGILQNKPGAAGDAADIMAFGVSKAVAGEVLTPGMLFGTDSSGRAKQVEHTNTGADVGDYYGGHVIVGAAAANELCTVFMGVPQGRADS